MSGELKKLFIESFTDEKFSGSPVATFTTMFNPDNYSVKYAVEYEEDQGKGTSALPQKFKRTKPIDLALTFMIDGTGASEDLMVDGSEPGKKDVIDKVRHFLSVVYEYDGEIHRPRYLRVAWGTLLFNCVFKGADVKYTLFKPDGNPLRATISASFYGTIDDEKRVAEESDKSPDLTRYHTVTAGETLPILAHKYYGDPRYYMAVARVNALNDFRTLEPGQTLLFPPISKTTTSAGGTA
ncbi:LysM peptidoglycan-binding domain-containing protein [Kordiimonas lacus]|uniref:LysM domain-containing protein n=1 Tax=Kordiimonas lacus TaxID=637679 RepID=A0A1G7A6Q8_9PROT|nr:LysM peptidoglycan-binding domain-containing protein [Kordiimonas lacus]SDE09556.1 hypothetical protein SAMN04488071_2078 [Kordiimonas lacus]